MRRVLYQLQVGQGGVSLRLFSIHVLFFLTWRVLYQLRLFSIHVLFFLTWRVLYQLRLFSIHVLFFLTFCPLVCVRIDGVIVFWTIAVYSIVNVRYLECLIHSPLYPTFDIGHSRQCVNCYRTGNSWNPMAIGLPMKRNVYATARKNRTNKNPNS